MLSFEGKRIDVGANKLKLGRFEIRAFCDKMRSFCTISASTFWKIQPENGNETLIFKRFGLFRSRFDSSDCQSPSKCFVLSNFDIPAYFKRFCLFRLTLAIAKVHLSLIFQRTDLVFDRRLQAQCPEYPPSPSQTFQSQALIKMATV